MLFDLKGKRRRVVQATYLTLAILMGGGLVLFGIGGDVQGGLFDAFSEGDGGGGGNAIVEQRLEQAEASLQTNPEDEQALTAVVRGHYQLANEQVDEEAGAFSSEGIAELEAAASAWERYLELDPRKPDDSLAGLMVQAYSEVGLNDPAKAAEAAGIVAEARPSVGGFLLLTRYAALAGQTRQADLAGDRAIELAPKADRETVAKQVKQAQAAAAAAAAGAGGQPGATGELPGGGQPAGPGQLEGGVPPGSGPSPGGRP